MHRQILAALAAFLMVSGCGDDGVDPADARSGAIDAPAGNPDAPPSPDAAPCATDLSPTDDGTGLAQDLLISEVDPGDFIELYNNTSSAIDLGSVSHQLCSPFLYAGLSSIAPDVVIAPGGFATVPFPSSFEDTDDGGEIMMYADSDFTNNDKIVDFLCWGTNPHGTRIDQATPTGKWSGNCAGALQNGSIQRLMSTDGTTSASYDVTSAPTPTSCE